MRRAGIRRAWRTLKEDLPALTWNGDGKHIYVTGSAGLYDVKLESGAVDRIGEGDVPRDNRLGAMRGRAGNAMASGRGDFWPSSW